MSSDSRKNYKAKEQCETKLDDLKQEYHQKQDEIFSAYQQGTQYLNRQHDSVYHLLVSLQLPDEIKNKAGYLFAEFGDTIMRQRNQAEIKLDDEFQLQQKELNKQLDELEDQ
ncbi:hypothetical protein [Fructilactobacillus carniphilus]|uniref:Uncharacterized protein n=1 Tax=Fructilactobacillus carniphilus TaxID=2940297 RepID=A0ABY5BZU6_9LACO|nr:hypothetical protein [Fructilactobacillus carniphilus]USS90565.1 hypothetical protein M3M37_06955 [Fructilactobacillus carniphilus]